MEPTDRPYTKEEKEAFQAYLKTPAGQEHLKQMEATIQKIIDAGVGFESNIESIKEITDGG